MDERSGDDLLTVPEAAERLKVSGVTVSRWIKQGRLRALKVGPRAVRIREEDLDRIMAPAGEGPPVAVAGADQASDPSPRAGGLSRISSPGSREDRLAVALEAQQLREKVLARRKGVSLPAAADELAGSGKKRRKAS